MVFDNTPMDPNQRNDANDGSFVRSLVVASVVHLGWVPDVLMLQELGAVRSRLRHVSATPGAAPTAPGILSRPATVDETDVEPGHCLSTIRV